MKDLEVTVSVRNNQLKARRQALGLSQKELCEAAGISLPVLCGLESLRIKPTRTLVDHRCNAPACQKNYAMKISHSFCAEHAAAPEHLRTRWQSEYQRPEVTVWSNTALALATFFAVDASELFPESLKSVANGKSVHTMDVPDLMAALGMASGEPTTTEIGDGIEKRQLREAAETALATLTPREARVLRRRFGFGRNGEEETFTEIGEREDVCGQRIREIEAKALRKLRHPSVSKSLKAVQ